MIRTRLSVAPNGSGVYEVGHDLTRGSYYDDLALRGTRIQTGSSYVLTPSAGHTMKIGATLGRASLDGTDSSAPVDLLRSDGSSAELITFLPERAPMAAAYLVAVHNGRDVQRDIARADFGATYNPTPRDFSFVFELLWGHR